jgi:ATP-dependent Clp protease ATP-binding subunit ClpA
MFHDLIIASRRLAVLYRFKLIQPSHLLHALTANETGRMVITNDGYDVHVLRACLIRLFKEYAPNVRDCGGRTEPSELFEKCFESTIYNEVKPYEENVRLLFGAIVHHASEDLIVQQALNEANLKQSDTPYIESEDELFPDLDELLAQEFESTENQDNELAPKGFMPEQQEQPEPGTRSMKSAFMDTMAKHKAAEPKSKPKSKLSKDMEEAKTAMLACLRDLSDLAREGKLDPVVGRESEIDHMVEILMRRRKPNIILVAEPGVGKSALVEGLAMRLTSGECPDPELQKRPLKEVSLTGMVAGSRYRGDFEARMNLMIEHATEEKAILFMDEIHTLVGSGSVGQRGMDGVNILKPALARDGLSVIGATTPDEALILRTDKALMRRFELIYIDEPLREQMETILEGACDKFLEKHEVFISEKICGRLLDFGDNYLQHRRNPDRTFDLLDLSAVSARLRGSKDINEDDLRHGVRRLGGVLLANKADSTLSDSLQDHLAKTVYGQSGAISRLCGLVREVKSGASVSAPIVLTGPKGTGKTHTASMVASHFGKKLIEVHVKNSDQAVSEVLKSILFYIEVDPEVVLAVKMSHGKPIKSIYEPVADLLKNKATSKEFALQNPVVFIISEEKQTRKMEIGFGRNSLDEPVDDDVQSVVFSTPKDDQLTEIIDKVLSRVLRMKQDAGLKVVSKTSLKEMYNKEFGDRHVTYESILSAALSLE